MYQIGDCVVYGIHGVCRIIGEEERLVDRRKIPYFVLEPVDQAGALFYVPSRNPAALEKLRKVLTREVLDALLSSDQVREDAWIADENQRKQRYRELISGGDRVALLQMIGSLHRYKKERLAVGRKFHLCDENFLHDAERLLNGEFSVVLGIEPSAVGAYVRSALE